MTQSFNDVLLFSINPKMFENNRKEISLEYLPPQSYAHARPTPPVCLHFHPCLLEGMRVQHSSSVVATSSL